MQFDQSKFTHPRFLYEEATLTAAGAAATPIATPNLRTSRDMIVDMIGISEEGYSINAGAANNTLMQYIDLNWQIVERARWCPVDLARAIDLHNVIGDRSTDPTQADLAGWGIMRWMHAVPWLYNEVDGVSVDWVNPASTIPGGTLTRNITFMMDGVGEKTGLRRTFQIPNFTITGSAAGAQQANSAFNAQNANNPGEEPYRICSTAIGFNGVAWAGTDSRVLNHMRLRVHPQVGDPWSEFPIPLCFYGPHMSNANRVVWHAFPGGPLLLRAGQAFAFEGRNTNAAINTRIQICIVGRIAPGIGSIA